MIYQERFEKAKGVMKSRKSKEGRQLNDQKTNYKIVTLSSAVSITIIRAQSNYKIVTVSRAVYITIIRTSSNYKAVTITF
jgi:hypothetical protein